jgi:hypothetical protein
MILGKYVEGEYFALRGIFESDHGMSPKGRWYGAILLDNHPVRIILDGEDAILARSKAIENEILDDADPSPLLETVTTGAMADFTGTKEESYNDNYEMPMDWRDRTSQKQADGRSVIFTPPFGPPVREEPDDVEGFGWKLINDVGVFVLLKSDGKTVNMVEISPSDDDTVIARSAIYTIEDLGKLDKQAGIHSGIGDEESWTQAPTWLRAYAKLLFYKQKETEYPSLADALRSETGLFKLPQEGV